MPAFIELKDASKAYISGEKEMFAADKVSFTINQGEFVVLLGPSGAGKSTVLNLLGGMDSATSGSIIVKNEDISRYSDDQLADYRARHVGFVFQNYNLIPTLTAYENVVLIKDAGRPQRHT